MRTSWRYAKRVACPDYMYARMYPVRMLILNCIWWIAISRTHDERGRTKDKKRRGPGKRERERDVSEKCFPFILTTASGRSDLSKIVSSPGVSFPGQLARKSSPSSRWRVIRLIRIKSCACYFTSSCFSFSREKKNSFQTIVATAAICTVTPVC